MIVQLQVAGFIAIGMFRVEAICTRISRSGRSHSVILTEEPCGPCVPCTKSGFGKRLRYSHQPGFAQRLSGWMETGLPSRADSKNPQITATLARLSSKVTSESLPSRIASAISSTSPIYSSWPLIRTVSTLSPRVMVIYAPTPGLNGFGMFNVPSLPTISMNTWNCVTKLE